MGWLSNVLPIVSPVSVLCFIRGANKANASQNADGDDEEEMPDVPDKVVFFLSAPSSMSCAFKLALMYC